MGRGRGWSAVFIHRWLVGFISWLTGCRLLRTVTVCLTRTVGSVGQAGMFALKISTCSQTRAWYAGGLEKMGQRCSLASRGGFPSLTFHFQIFCVYVATQPPFQKSTGCDGQVFVSLRPKLSITHCTSHILLNIFFIITVVLHFSSQILKVRNFTAGKTFCQHCQLLGCSCGHGGARV